MQIGIKNQANPLMSEEQGMLLAAQLPGNYNFSMTTISATAKY
jgi:hypothetical protein